MCDYCVNRERVLRECAEKNVEMFDPEWEEPDDGRSPDHKLLENITDQWEMEAPDRVTTSKWVSRRYGHDVYKMHVKNELAFDLVPDRDDPGGTVAMYRKKEVARTLRKEGYGPIDRRRKMHTNVWPAIVALIHTHNVGLFNTQFSCSMNFFCRMLRARGCGVKREELKHILLNIVQKKASVRGIVVEVKYDNRAYR
jgi:hypothetical protein